MGGACSLQDSVAWKFEPEVPVADVAMVATGALALVADADRNIHIIDEKGDSRASFRVTYPVRALRADHGGSIFAALGGGVVYAFDVKGQFEWRVELDADVTDFDMDPSGQCLAAVTAGGRLYVYYPETHERRMATVGRALTAVALAAIDEVQVVVCDEDGQVSLLGATGEASWRKDVGACLGGASVSPIGGVIAVPTQEHGLMVFDLGGQEMASIDMGEPVLRAVVAADGSLIAAQTVGHRLALLTMDGTVQGELQFSGPPVAWAMGLGGRMLTVAESAHKVVAYRFREAPSARATRTPGERVLKSAGERPALEGRGEPPGPELPDAGEPGDGETEEYLEVERIIAGSTPAGGGPGYSPERLVWKKKLPAELVPSERCHFRLGMDGDHVVLVLTDGTLVVLNQRGEMRLKAKTPMPACLAPRLPSRCFAVWSAENVLRIDPREETLSMTPLGPPSVGCFDCSGDALFGCAVDSSNVLRAFRGSGSPVWERDLKAPVSALFVSPQGKMVLVSDEDGRQLFYNAAGKLLRKFRFAGSQAYIALGLGDGFSVFGAEGGTVLVLDAEGHEMWSERLFEELADLELFGMSLAAYGVGGACVAVDPLERLVWDFRPPPGQVRLRKPSGQDPIVVHSAGKVITAFKGYGREMQVVWCFECAQEVTMFDIDGSGRHVVALAGDRLYWIEGGLAI